MPVYLHGISAKNYRGIGPCHQKAGPFRECNFFIGTNNSGKSNFLNLIASHLGAIGTESRRGSQLSLQPLETHLGATIHEVEVGFAIPLEEAIERTKVLLNHNVRGQSESIDQTLKRLLHALSDDGVIWMKAAATNLADLGFAKLTVVEMKNALTHSSWSTLWRSITGRGNGDIDAHWIPEVLQRLSQTLRIPYPDAKLIPAKRQIGKKGENFGDFSGVGLIDKLAELQNPGPTKRVLKQSFEKINQFLQDVTGDPSAMIEIPHDREEVLVHKGKRVLPLSSLGTGIHEVVMIAAFCTLTEECIVCIEEPEIHLHPLLQKKLIQYITRNTNNQYFIATHSASIIDQPGAVVFHVTQKDLETRVELAAAPTQRFRACQDLGYRASDFLQTNSIVWVEGPSDRIYLKHWITTLDSSLQEGIHYSIMYYGGRLLSHLSAVDDEISEFIALRKLNRNMAIIIDSDKKSAASRVNETKKRIISEFTTHGELAWLTAGREIENYLNPAILNSVLSNLYSSFSRVASTDRYSHRLHFVQNGKEANVQIDIDKVKVARSVCEHPADLTVLDLAPRIREIISMIKQANA